MSAKQIKVRCSCKRRFRAHTDLAGKTVHCPGCHQELQIPNADPDTYQIKGNADAAAKADRKAKREWESCPDCSGPLENESVLCTNCGFNRRTSGSEKSTKHAASELFWHRIVPAIAGITVICGLIQILLAGVSFLIAYAVLWCLCIAAAIGSEFKNINKVHTAVACLIGWEALGCMRFLFGLSAGMQTFDYMFLMMVLGPIVGAGVVFGEFNSSGHFCWLGESNCGGGCGGGGCGGGGCGGCGGGD